MAPVFSGLGKWVAEGFFVDRSASTKTSPGQPTQTHPILKRRQKTTCSSKIQSYWGDSAANSWVLFVDSWEARTGKPVFFVVGILGDLTFPCLWDCPEGVWSQGSSSSSWTRMPTFRRGTNWKRTSYTTEWVIVANLKNAFLMHTLSLFVILFSISSSDRLFDRHVYRLQTTCLEMVQHFNSWQVALMGTNFCTSAKSPGSRKCELNVCIVTQVMSSKKGGNLGHFFAAFFLWRLKCFLA